MNLFRKTGFTGSEAAIIITLVITFAAGIAVKYSGWKRPGNYSYSEPDRQFEAKTKLAFTELKQQNLTENQLERSAGINRIYDSLLAGNNNNSSNVKLNKKININTAFTADLMLLPGIGEVTAERIIEYREENNGFKKTDELLKIKGIGEKKFEKLKEFITVE